MTDANPPERPSSYDKKIGLVLQGGGALGSYQAGVYEALASSEYLPDWVAGISIGAINAAIIAGNTRENRVKRLRSFWQEITAPTSLWPFATSGSLTAWQQKACPDSADVRPAWLFHPTHAAGLVFTGQVYQLLRHLGPQGDTGTAG